jgi:hypothetical protein
MEKTIMDFKRFMDKNTQRTYRMVKVDDWTVLLESEDRGGQILTTINLLMAHYQPVNT